MKNKMLKSAFAVAFVMVAGYGVYVSQQKNEMSDLMIENIEALGQSEGGYDQKIWERYYRPEGDGYNCIKGGSESC